MAAISVPVILVQNHASERGGRVADRNTGPAGGPTASSEPAPAPPMKAAPDPALALRDAVEANPEDIDARLTLIRAQIGRRRYIQA